MECAHQATIWGQVAAIFWCRDSRCDEAAVASSNPYLAGFAGDQLNTTAQDDVFMVCRGTNSDNDLAGV